MPQYTIKNVTLDIGFVSGYLRAHAGQAVLFEAMVDALDRADARILVAKLTSTGELHEEDLRCLLSELGFIRGLIWLTPTHDACSDAMDRLIEFLVEGAVDWYQLPRPWRPRPDEPLVTDQQRDQANCAYLESVETAASELELPTAVIERIVHPKVKEDVDRYRNQNDRAAHADIRPSAAITPTAEGFTPSQIESPNPFNPNGKRGRREWTPEQRAAQAERARNRHNDMPPFDSDLEAVKADWEAGTPFDKIGSKWGCSGSHIRNFLTKHGIDPRRGRVKRGGESPLTETEHQVVVEGETATHGPVAELDEGEPVAPKRHASDSPASRWKPSPIDSAEWPDIQQMLADGRSREAIASDYDVPVQDLDDFIQARLQEGRKRRGESPGESAAPLH